MQDGYYWVLQQGSDDPEIWRRANGCWNVPGFVNLNCTCEYFDKSFCECPVKLVTCQRVKTPIYLTSLAREIKSGKIRL